MREPVHSVYNLFRVENPSKSAPISEEGLTCFNCANCVTHPLGLHILAATLFIFLSALPLYQTSTSPIRILLLAHQVMTTLIPPYAAVIAALNISLGADVGGFFLEVIAKELNAVILSGAKLPAIRHGNGRRGLRGTGSNVLLLLAYLYNYGVAHCTLIYDIIGLLVDGECNSGKFVHHDSVGKRFFGDAIRGIGRSFAST